MSPRETLYTDLGGQLGREQFDDDVALECGLVRTKVAAHATAAEFAVEDVAITQRQRQPRSEEFIG